MLLDQALAGAKDAGAKVEKIILSKKKISGCLACERCNETGVCAVKDDMLEIHKKILEANAVIHSVPVYFWAMTAQMKAYLDRWCAFFDAEWQWHKKYYPKMKDKKIGLITVCGDPDVSIADPIVHSFKTATDFGKLKWLGVVQASAAAKGEIDKDEKAKRKAYALGKKAVTS
jgi:multimeric flavodoxin WrbA